MSLWSRIERRLSDLAGEILPDELRDEIAAARDLLASGRAGEAARALELLVAERPDHAGALSLLGAARLELGDLDGAHTAFEQALRVRGDAAEALLGRAQADLALGRLDAALDGFRAAVRAAGGDRNVLAMAYRGLGMLYRQRGEVDKAVRELRKAVAEHPDDLLARAALGEALLADPRISAEEARYHLDLAARDAGAAQDMGARDAASARVIAALALGHIALADEDGDSARAHFAQALDALAALATAHDAVASTRQRARDAVALRGHVAHRHQALLGLGDAALLLGDPHAAHRHYLEALELTPRSAAVHARIGDAHRRIGDHDAALAGYQRALAFEQDPAVLDRALDTALAAGAVDTAVRLAGDMLAIDPGHGRAAVARGLGLAKQGQHEAARATFRAALDAGGALDAHLALGRLELDLARDDGDRGAGARAAAEALAALRLAPSSARARALLAEARERELMPRAAEDRDPATGMVRLAAELRHLALARPELAALAGEAARAAADFDQPLLVTVMGEFSSGKSTVVNAFIGHDVAPTGITPTTATINIVKYGREPGGRIAYRDGTLDPLSWDELFRTLHGLDAERVRRIDVVEILFPLPQLERVNIVDTPGLNSILPEHEEVARGFIARADAVVWVFTANQAGKRSERLALQRIRQEGKRVLGVLNKMDQLSAADVEQLVAYVQAELGELVELVVPVSARAALEHGRAGAAPGPAAESRAATPDHAAGRAQAGAQTEVEDGNWPALDAALETRFFAQARELKRDALARRLAGALARARDTVTPVLARALAAAAALRRESEILADAYTEFIDRVVLAQRTALQDATAALYRQAAREVLELVRPRQLPFGSHSATPADRAYLIALLESGYEAALETSRRAVLQALEAHKSRAVNAIAAVTGTLGADAAGDMTRTAEDALRLVAAQVFDAARAYLRGYVRGGYVASFFRRDLPKLELAEDAAYDALVRGAPDLDAEIGLRLATAGTTAISAMAGRLAHWADVAEVMAYDVEVGVGRALDDLAQRCERWAPARAAADADAAARADTTDHGTKSKQDSE